MDRRKIILFTHDLSFYSFLLVGVKKSELDYLENAFIDSTADHLLKDGFSEKEIESLLPVQSHITFCKSHNRSIIGTMNNFGRFIPYLYDRYGMILDRIPTLNQFHVSKEFNDTPVQCDKKGFYPLERLKEIVKENEDDT